MFDLIGIFSSTDGKSLVHALQVRQTYFKSTTFNFLLAALLKLSNFQAQYIHQLVQSRLFAEEDPLVDLYKCLRILY